MNASSSKSSHCVVQVIPSLDLGGAERTTIEMTAAIVAKGWRAIVVTQGGHQQNEIIKAGGELVLMPVKSKNPFTIWRNVGRLKKLIQKHDVSLVHARSRAPAWSCYLAARAQNVPFITTYHGAYKAKTRLKHWYNSSMIRGVRVIANSAFTKSLILESYGATDPNLANRINVVFRGADMKRFTPSIYPNQSASKDAPIGLVEGRSINSSLSQNPLLSQNSSLPQNSENKTVQPFRLLLPARMSAWKGHEIVIKSLLTFSRAGQQPNLRIVFLGGAHHDFDPDDDFGMQGATGESHVKDVGIFGRSSFQASSKNSEHMSAYEAHLREMVVKNGISELVHFAGHSNQMADALAWADGVLVPSTRPEAFGRVVVEAGAMAKPVIASDHGGARETIIDQKTGFLVPPSDPIALGNAIQHLMKMSEQERLAMGRAAHDHVKENFTTQTMCDQTIAIYCDVIEGAHHV